ncbi:MAG: hypothetical protein WC310_00190 [Patescibacteria group bacterium]|jgi:hypothetical protein
MEKEIVPNFTNEISKLAEERMRVLFEIAKDLGVEVLSLQESREKILEHVRRELPQRYELVVQKLQKEGLSLSDLSNETLTDRLLGIDLLFRFNGKTYAVDVTSGKSVVVINKQKKFKQMEDLYKKLGINYALIIRLKEDITENTVFDLLSRLENIDANESTFTITIRYPDTKNKQ